MANLDPAVLQSELPIEEWLKQLGRSNPPLPPGPVFGGLDPAKPVNVTPPPEGNLVMADQPANPASQAPLAYDANFNLPPAPPASAPESDKSSGRALAAPDSGLNVGTAPVPPPVPTNVPIREPEPSEAAPEGPVREYPQWGLKVFPDGRVQRNGVFLSEQATQPAPTKDPNELLRQAYKPALDMAMEARRKDLERQTGLPAQALGQRFLMHGILGRDAGLSAVGAGLIKRAQTDPLEVDSLEKASRASQEMIKAQTAQMELDPNSDIAEGQRIALLGHSGVSEWATKQSAMTGRSVHDIKSELYGQMKTLSPVGMKVFLDTVKASGDYSKQRAEEALNYANAAQAGAMTEKIRTETADMQALQKAWNDSNSGVSQFYRASVRGLVPEHVVSQTPNFDRMTAHELSKTFPDALKTSAELLKWHQEYNMRVASDTQVDDETVVRTQMVPGPVAGMPGKAVPNAIGVANRREYLEQKGAAKTAMDSGDQLFRVISGAGDAASYSLQTPAGQKIYNNLMTFARSASVLSPSGKALLEQLTAVKPDGTIIPSQFIFGSKGKKGSVQAAMQEINTAFQTASQPYLYPDVQMKGIPPSYPPLYLPMTIQDNKDAKGRSYKSYIVEIGGKKWEYFKPSANSPWVHEEVK